MQAALMLPNWVLKLLVGASTIGVGLLTARADDLNRDTHQVLEINPTAITSVDQTESVLMDIAGPLAIDVGPGETIRSAIERSCPGATSVYYDLALLTIRELNVDPIASLDDKVESQEKKLLIPFCLGNKLDRYVIKTGDNLWKIYELQKKLPNGVNDWRTFQEQLQQYNGNASSPSLGVGDELYLPKGTVKVPIENTEVPAAVEKLNKNIPNLQVKEPNWGRIQETADEGACGDPESSDRKVAEIFSQTTKILTLNDYIDNNNVSWSRSGDDLTVGIFDTGIEGLTVPAMKNGRRKISSFVQEADQTALQGYKAKFHGGGVMSVALGGPFYTQIGPLLNWINVAPYRIIEELCWKPAADKAAICDFVATEDRLLFAMSEAARPSSKISVVNLSVAFPKEIAGFSRFINPDNPYLVVVAAGNAGLTLSTANPSYPAMAGGADLSNIISVSAVDIHGSIAATSNVSHDYVDIAAWGCSIPVMEYDPKKNALKLNYRSGTSYAAPQVSFIAALLNREHKADSSIKSPNEIKKRILYSADIKPVLWGGIRHGRVLNVQKALSIYSDFVELKDGIEIWGRVDINDNSTDSIKLCPDTPLSRSKLRKIARLDPIPDDPSAKRYLIYTDDPAIGDGAVSPLKTYWCDALVGSFKVRDLLTNQDIVLDATSINDIVFASDPYWQ